MRLIFMGTPAFSVPALDALISAGHDVACVYTRAPRSAGRGQSVRPSPVHDRAAALGLPVRLPGSLKDPDQQAAFAAVEAEIAVVVAYGLILPQQVLDAPARGGLNIHASLLPRWRGAAPIQRAVIAGDRETGVTIMRMEAGLDTGPILLERRVEIGETTTAGDLHERLAALGAEAIVAALAELDHLRPAPQPAAGVTYAAKLDKAEARVDWTCPADQIARQINGLSPFPGAWGLAGTERIKLLRARAVPGRGAPGQVLGGLIIACGSGAVEVLEIQREGKRPLPVAEALRGLTLPDRVG